MAFASVQLIPGINVEKTPTLNMAGISESEHIRFRDGMPQKLGGWSQFYGFAVGGIPRALHAWQDLNEVDRLAVGTTTELDIISNGANAQITPQIKLTNFNENFSTTISTPNIIIVDPNISDVTPYDSVYFNTPVSVGGVILSGLYKIDLNLGGTSYRILARSNATSTVANVGLVPTFGTTSGSTSVNVTLANHGLAVGDTFNIPIPVTVGGVTLVGTYSAISITSTSVFVIAADSIASSTTSLAMNGGQAQILYHIAIGPTATGTGYGIGTYGSGGYGTGVVPGVQYGTPITSTGWTFDNWGDNLLACAENGGIYAWRANSEIQNAQLIENAPIFNGGIFVAMPAQILVAWGSTATQNIGVDQDPLLVKWSDQLDYTNWTASTTTQAGSFHIPTGSRIVGALQGPQNAILWTDLDVWAMQYVGYPIVFGFNKIGSSCGLISAHAAAQLGGTVFWMGRSNFFALTGNGASPIPCTVWDKVFQDLDTSNQHKCWAEANTVFNEVWFFYPSLSGGTGECDSYVKLNVVEGAWDYDSLDRSAGIDQSILGAPIMATSTGLIYSHETGNNAGTQVMRSSFTTGYWRINEGGDIAFIDWILPDMRFGLLGGPQTASLTITFYSKMYPGDAPEVHGPYAFTQSTESIVTRIRGRQMAMKVESNDLGSFWRLGKIAYRFAADGRN